MLSHTYHAPISSLHLIFEFAKKKFSFFHFYAYFLKGNFKELPEKLFSARFQLFFHRILQFFLQCKTMSTCVLKMFLHDAEQVFILNLTIWRPQSENCFIYTGYVDSTYYFSVQLQLKLYVKAVMRISMICGFEVISGNIAQNLINHNENLFSIM